MKTVNIELSNLKDDLTNIQALLDKANLNLINEQSVYLFDLVRKSFPYQIPIQEGLQSSVSNLKSAFERIQQQFDLNQIFVASTLAYDFETRLNLFQREFRTPQNTEVLGFKYELEKLVAELKRITKLELARIETSLFQDNSVKINDLSREFSLVKADFFNSFGYNRKAPSISIDKIFYEIYAQLNANRDKFFKDLKFLVAKKYALFDEKLTQANEDLLLALKSYRRQRLQTEPQVLDGEFTFEIRFEDVAKALIESSSNKKRRQVVSCASNSFNFDSFTQDVRMKKFLLSLLFIF